MNVKYDIIRFFEHETITVAYSKTTRNIFYTIRQQCFFRLFFILRHICQYDCVCNVWIYLF